jgi:thioredoxin reductase
MENPEYLTMAGGASEACDVVIIGAGPAGLNAALILGRCRRNAVMLDSGKPRNGASRALHGFLSRDGTPPMELRELGRQQLLNYPSVVVRENTEVVRVAREGKGFRIEIADGSALTAPFLLLATGRIDLVPSKPGFRDFYGHGVFHCVYCDGWEHRDQKLVAYGSGEDACDLALNLLCWSRDVKLCTDGLPELGEDQRAKLRANGVEIFENNILTLRGDSEGRIRAITFEGRDDLPCDALFFCSDCLQKSNLAEELGCQLDESGSVTCDEHAATGVPGLFVAGNVRGGVHLAIVAAAEGAAAGMAINSSLHAQRLK